MSVPEIPQYVVVMHSVLILMVVMSVHATWDTLAMEQTAQVRIYSIFLINSDVGMQYVKNHGEKKKFP